MTVVTITGVRLFGHADPRPHDVVVRDGLIERVGPTGVAGEGDVVDGKGHTLVAGLIDTHVHLTGRDELEAAARAGVTTVVDLGTHPDSLVDSLRQEGRRDAVSAVVSAGSAASAPGSNQISRMGFPNESGVTGPEDAERYLTWRSDNGVDLIKIIIEDPAATDVPALSPETLAALVAAAHRRGLLTVAHVVTAQAFTRGLDAGVDILTHAPLDRPLSEEALERMVESGVVASPTLV
ncbi:MAG TPA: amidohydrolase family protein, partial [Trebonia sp.]